VQVTGAETHLALVGAVFHESFQRLLRLLQRVVQFLLDPGQRGEVDVVLKPHPRTPFSRLCLTRRCLSRLCRASCLRLLPALRQSARSFAMVVQFRITLSSAA
jgi:hypothetical protein